MKDFQTITRWMHGLNSSYHALQVSLDKRYSRGFTVSASYTWSKNLDYVSRAGFGGSFGINNPFEFLLLARHFGSEPGPPVRHQFRG